MLLRHWIWLTFADQQTTNFLSARLREQFTFKTQAVKISSDS
jgi:hypothetical protein